jgi:maleylacetoacetate isomerase
VDAHGELALGFFLKKIPYEYRSTNIRAGEQLQEEYFKLNPSRKVPALFIDGHSLFQSRAILEYLDETRPDPPLLPRDPHQAYERAHIRAICDMITSDIQPLQNAAVLQKHKADIDSSEKAQAWARHWIHNGFIGLESRLAQTSSKYSFGDSLTMVDVCLVPQVRNAHRFFLHLDMSPFPTLSRLYEALLREPAFETTRPEAQPDAEQNPCHVYVKEAYFLLTKRWPPSVGHNFMPSGWYQRY